MEAPPGFEPGMEVLQTSALPLGDGAGRNSIVQGIFRPRLYARQQQRAGRFIWRIVFLVPAKACSRSG